MLDSLVKVATTSFDIHRKSALTGKQGDLPPAIAIDQGLH
jgi:hypothetical protein